MRAPKTHELKTWPTQYHEVCSRQKTFELRVNDRDFAVGDELLLREWEPTTKNYTGRSVVVGVTSILSGGQFGLAEGLCIMSIRRDVGSQ